MASVVQRLAHVGNAHGSAALFAEMRVPLLALVALLAALSPPRASSASAASAASATSTAAAAEDSEALVGRLHAALQELRDENAALRRRLALLDASSASMPAALGASAATLKAEVFRLVRKEQEIAVARRAAADEAAGAAGAGVGAGAGAGASAGARAGAEDADEAAEAEAAWRRPQQVSVVCKEAAVWSVLPLAEEDRPNDECLVLHVQAPELDARFVLYCDDEEAEEAEEAGAWPEAGAEADTDAEGPPR